MPVIGKVLDTLLLQRADPWLDRKLDELQGANRKGTSSLETSAVLQTAISHHVNQGHTVSVAMLDVKKAFDTVWHDGLFVKLLDMGMDPKLWRLLRNSYDGFECAVRIGGQVSRWFEPEQGVHQGDVFSMRLHSLYINGLLAELRDIACGTHVDTINCGHPTFADDVALVSTSKRSLNRQLAVCSKYSRDWRFDFAPAKCCVLIFGRDTQPRVDITLSGHTLKVVKGHTHVGVPVCTTQTAETDMIQERAKRCRRKYFMIESISTPHSRINPLGLARIYSSVCVPGLCYGAETWTPSDSGLEAMEKVHQQIGRRIQGLPPNASKPVSYAMLGWKTIEAIFDLAKLVWVWRLLTIPNTSPYQRLVLRTFNDCRFPGTTPDEQAVGPFVAAYLVFCKYRLTGLLHDMMYSTDSLVTRRRWVSICERTVHSWHETKWRMVRIMYPRLETFNMVVDGVTRNIWWTVCRHNPKMTTVCKRVVRLMTGENNLNAYRGRYLNNTRTSSTCSLCDLYETESVVHLLTGCTALQVQRDRLWDEHMRDIPRGMADSMSSMGPRDRVVFMLSGFGSPYIPEWQSVYEGMARYIASVYTTRLNLNMPGQ